MAEYELRRHLSPETEKKVATKLCSEDELNILSDKDIKEILGFRLAIFTELVCLYDCSVEYLQALVKNYGKNATKYAKQIVVCFPKETVLELDVIENFVAELVEKYCL